MRKIFLTLAFSLAMLGALPHPTHACPAGQSLVRAAEHLARPGPGTLFTGQGTITPLFSENHAAPFGAAYLSFAPGSRTFWHSHPYGQHLVVTAGIGRTGYRGGKVETIKTGDVIWCPPGIEHWHGAGPETSMTHLAITGIRDGMNHAWMEAVTDKEYFGKQGSLPPHATDVPVGRFSE